MTIGSNGQRLGRLARRLALSNGDPAVGPEDLLQEARITVWRRRAAIASSPNPRASVYLVARQAMVSELRRSRRAMPGYTGAAGAEAADGEDDVPDACPKEGNADGR